MGGGEVAVERPTTRPMRRDEADEEAVEGCCGNTDHGCFEEVCRGA